MAKQIQPTEAAVDAALAKARTQLLEGKSSDRKIKLEVTLPVTKKRARIQFTPVAYAKMIALIQGFTTEVAWHGIASKLDDGLFHISDILVYPQTVTGASVRTEEQEYGKWLMDFDDDTFNALRMQGHSHVNMRVSPSGTDTTDQNIILNQMGSGCKFYIFMIWNKKLERNIWIYDLEANLLYDTDDVDISIGQEDTDIETFLAGAKEVVKIPAPAKVVKSAAAQYPPDYGFPGQDDEPWYTGVGGPPTGVRVKQPKGGARKRESG